MKTSWKNVALFLAALSMVLVVLTAIDTAAEMQTDASVTLLRVTVVDLQDAPLHNAEVTVFGQTFFTDNNGRSPVIQAEEQNSYGDITSWHTATVTVQKQGFVPAVVINCVLTDGKQRDLKVRLYGVDGSRGNSGKPTQRAFKTLMEQIQADKPAKQFFWDDDVKPYQFNTSTGAIVSGGGRTGYYTDDNLPDSSTASLLGDDAAALGQITADALANQAATDPAA